MGQNCCSYDVKNPEGEVKNETVPINSSKWTEQETKACVQIQANFRGHLSRAKYNKVKVSDKPTMQLTIPSGMELNYENESVKVNHFLTVNFLAENAKDYWGIRL